MARNESVHSCFKELSNRLTYLKGENDKRQFNDKDSNIKDIYDRGISEFDEEYVQSAIYFYKEKIEALQKEIDIIFKNIKYEAEERYVKDPWDSVRFSPRKVKSEIKNNIKKELEFYIIELDNLLNETVGKLDSLGEERFSNAGLMVALNLTVDEIGCLFGLLYEEGIIINKKKDKSVLQKKELAGFISNNFLNSYGKQISAKNLENHLKSDNQASASIETKLEELKTRISG